MESMTARKTDQEIRCPRCENYYPPSGFNANKAHPTGRQTYCKSCQAERTRSKRASEQAEVVDIRLRLTPERRIQLDLDAMGIGGRNLAIHRTGRNRYVARLDDTVSRRQLTFWIRLTAKGDPRVAEVAWGWLRRPEADRRVSNLPSIGEACRGIKI